jgi:hypothetical protein
MSLVSKPQGIKVHYSNTNDIPVQQEVKKGGSNADSVDQQAKAINPLEVKSKKQESKSKGEKSGKAKKSDAKTKVASKSIKPAKADATKTKTPPASEPVDHENETMQRLKASIENGDFNDELEIFASLKEIEDSLTRPSDQ